MYLQYYVYAYLRKDGTPYYIGKGTKRRAWSKDHKVRVPSEAARIIIVESKLTSVGAYALERRLIRWYGRKDLGTGILRNCTDGGDGGKGNPKGVVILPETREKLRIANLGKTASEETRRKLSEAGKRRRWVNGRVFDEEWRRKLGEAGKGRLPANKGMLWWNNGELNKLSFELPGDGWVRGQLKRRYG